ncbi:MAG: hypothetical protein ACTTI3_05880 [Treponema sp.]
MKTDASVEIVRWEGSELTVRLVGEIDKREMDCYIQHRRELYKRNMQENKRPFHYPPIELLLSDKYKKRSTGKHSQNTKLHGMIRIIANSTGNPFDVVKAEVKRKAMNELQYPVQKDELGGVAWNKLLNEPFPQSEAECTTVEESILIEAAYLIAADLGIFIDGV